MAPKRPLRKRYIIKPAYQLKIALILVISFILYSAVLAFILFYPLFKELYAGATPGDQARAANTILYLHTRLWPAILVVAALVGVHAIIVSHRFFGPIYRFEETLKGFLKGNFSQRIRLRKHDNLKETEALFNRVAEYLEEARRRDLELHDSVKEKLKEVSERLASGDKKDLSLAREKIASIMDELNGMG